MYTEPANGEARLNDSSASRPFGHRLILLIGGLGPLGRAPASGSVTVAVVGIPVFVLASSRFLAVPLWAYVTAVVLLAASAVWVHDIGDRILGEKDSRRLVLDELVGYFIAMTAVPPTWQLIALGYVVERALDIAKVPPANWIERRLPGGWGVVGDDVIAGLYTLALLHLAAWAAPAAMGCAAS